MEEIDGQFSLQLSTFCMQNDLIQLPFYITMSNISQIIIDRLLHLSSSYRGVVT